MKIVVLLMLLTESAFACNQKVYDLVYSQILDEAVEGKMSQETRNNTIEWLRQLCGSGMRSNFETGAEPVHKQIVCLRMSPDTKTVLTIGEK